jgi:hypothetical protein
MLEEIYQEFEMLQRENWGDNLNVSYERIKFDVSSYSTMIDSNDQASFEVGLRKVLKKKRWKGESMHKNVSKKARM